jgi:hypothetical protein
LKWNVPDNNKRDNLNNVLHGMVLITITELPEQCPARDGPDNNKRDNLNNVLHGMVLVD